MLFLPLSILLFLLFILLLPLLFFLLQMKLVGHALVKIGISPAVATLIFFLSIIGSLINIPLLSGNQNIAINVGGAIIPLLLCIYLFPKVPILKTIIAVMISALIMNKMAQPIPMVGVTIPMFIPPLVAVLLGFIFSPRNPTPVAYIAGVLGVLIGADLMNLSQVTGAGMMSIGGAGVYDGIFLVGIISALIG
ncbi:MAG: hypothetical protein COZ37_00630 [bacterium (Candidatus Ratteibacteria) CG_4_10_14_3_um_filter_41_18]|uniref:DUF1614 domain-containing protein n=2 Tax=Candidatus Ratteibacteria TaxID=2979319 RepID=A0A2M7EAT8_9BACT|nr:MAG: hypothetical protein COS11_00310 [bacterium (Candidatus Ratteibacteria) CG01_land_8_20_14_3_00_40_19]PIX77834.1 MAG: hypothetical protein COZ37_00630 [bacterium (Candidatus Ratteibacteria) CG_4_10_14_3_um_filter_41_18]